MKLLIACILIYHFGLPWWLYVLAGVVAGLQAWLTLWMATNESEAMDRRFSMLQMQLTERTSAIISSIVQRDR